MEDQISSPLKPNHRQHDFFMCDLSDAILKDDMASMESPVFTLSKNPDMREKYYEHNGTSLTITPSIKGHATIYDKDILIYAISKIMQAKNQGKDISKYVIFEAQECLRFIHRTAKNGNPGGKDYRSLEAALKRLVGTTLQTDIPTGNIIQTEMFHLVDSVTIHRESKDGRVLEWGLKFSDWTWNAINAHEILTLHKDYFRLKKPLEKRIYELARRQCGSKKNWHIRLELLLKKSGSASTLNKFRHNLKLIEKTDHLPDYHIEISKHDVVTFTLKSESNIREPRPKTDHYTADKLDHALDDQARATTRQLASEKRRDIYRLQGEFAELLNSNREPRKSLAGSFIAFIKSKTKL